MSSPIIILVPSAFSSPFGYNKLLPYLKKARFSTHPGPYPSCNPLDPATATAPKDIASLRNNILLPLTKSEKKDAVVIAHSYGGLVAEAAAKDLDKSSRKAKGQTSSIISLIYGDMVHFKSGHMPFVSQPEALASAIVKFTKRFITV